MLKKTSSSNKQSFDIQKSNTFIMASDKDECGDFPKNITASGGRQRSLSFSSTKPKPLATIMEEDGNHDLSSPSTPSSSRKSNSNLIINRRASTSSPLLTQVLRSNFKSQEQDSCTPANG